MDKKYPVMYTIKDIQKIFSMGQTKAYQLMTSDGFPAIRLNNRLYVSQEKLELWLNKNCGKSIKF